MLAKLLISTGMRVALGLFEQQRRAALLHGAVGELGDFENRIHLERDALQFSFFFQRADEVAQIAIGHIIELYQQIPQKERQCPIELHSSPAPAAASDGPRALALQQAGYDIVVAAFEVEKNEEVAAEIRAAGGKP